MKPPHLRLLCERPSEFVAAWPEFAHPKDAATALRTSAVTLAEAEERLQVDVSGGFAELARRLPVGQEGDTPHRKAVAAVRGQLAAAAAYHAFETQPERVGGFLTQAIEAFAGERLPQPSRLLQAGTLVPTYGHALDVQLADAATSYRDRPLLAAGFCAVRDVVAFLAGDNDYRYRPVRARGRVPVLAVGESEQDQDWVGWLRIDVLGGGMGAVYPDPVRFGPVVMDGLFRATASLARDVAKGVLLADAVADSLDLSACDIRWSLETKDLPRHPRWKCLTPLVGGSLGAAFAVNLARMRHGLPAEEHIALTGKVNRDGDIESVGGVRRKVKAALGARDAEGGRRVARVIVPQANENEARGAASEAGRNDESLCVAVADRVMEGLARVRDYRLDADRLRTRDSMDCATRVADFLDYYRYEKNRRPAPFGGRDAELAQLREVLLRPSNSAAPCYTLLAGSAGVGKSALLVKLLDNLSDTLPDGWSHVFVPISSRFTTNARDNVFAMLGWQLCRAHGPDQFPDARGWDERQWRDRCAELLRRKLPDGRRLVVIIDGLDEMLPDGVREGFGDVLFPTRDVPSGLHVILSARDRSDSLDYWQKNLGWDGLPSARTVRVTKLTQGGVQDILDKSGFSSQDPAHLIEQLYRLSDGFPLLVRLYINLLHERREEFPHLTKADLPRIRGSGLDAFFKEFWEKRLEEHSREAAEVAWQIRQVLAATFGPIPLNDLLRLAAVKPAAFAARIAMRALSTFLAGDASSGWVYSHPEFGRFLWDGLDAAARRELDDRFLSWGKEELHAIQSKPYTMATGDPAEVPHYLVRHLGKHLDRVLADAGRKAREKEGAGNLLRQFLGDGWCQAWQRVDGISQYAGYLMDVNRVEAWAVGENKRALKMDRLLPALDAEVYASLVRGSIISLSDRLLPPWLAAMIELDPEQGGWHGWQVLQAIQRMTRSDRRSEALACVIPHLSREEDHRAARQLINSIEGDYDRSWGLAALAERLPPDEARRVIDSIKHTDARSRALMALAQKLPPDERDNALRQARQLIDSIVSEKHRSWGLVALAEKSPPDQARQVIDSIKYADDRSRVLMALAETVPPHKRGDALRQARQVIDSINDAAARSRTLVALAEKLPPDQAREIVDTIEDAQIRSQRRLYLVVELHLDQARRVIDSIKYADSRSRALTALAERFPPHERDNTLRQAIDSIEYALGRSEALARLDRRANSYDNSELYQSWLDRRFAPSLNLQAQERDVSSETDANGRSFANLNREFWLKDIECWVPVLALLATSDTLRAVADSIIDVGRRWP